MVGRNSGSPSSVRDVLRAIRDNEKQMPHAKELGTFLFVFISGLIFILALPQSVPDGVSIGRLYHPIIVWPVYCLLMAIGTRLVFYVFYNWQRANLVRWIYLGILSSLLVPLYFVLVSSRDATVNDWVHKVPQAKESHYRILSSRIDVKIDCNTSGAIIKRWQKIVPDARLEEFVEKNLYSSGPLTLDDIEPKIYEANGDSLGAEIPSYKAMRKVKLSGDDGVPIEVACFAQVIAGGSGLVDGREYIRVVEINARGSYTDEFSDTFRVTCIAAVEKLTCDVRFTGFCSIDPIATTVELDEVKWPIPPGLSTPSYVGSETIRNANELLVASYSTDNGSHITVEAKDLKQGNQLAISWRYLISPRQGMYREVARN